MPQVIKDFCCDAGWITLEKFKGVYLLTIRYPDMKINRSFKYLESAVEDFDIEKDVMMRECSD